MLKSPFKVSFFPSYISLLYRCYFFDAESWVNIQVSGDVQNWNEMQMVGMEKKS